jgi:3-dehydroquinate synthase
LGAAARGVDVSNFMADPLQPISRAIQVVQEHRLFFTRDVFASENQLLADILTPREPGEKVRALVVWDSGIARSSANYAKKISTWFEAHRDTVSLAAPPLEVHGGEMVKNAFGELERVWRAIEEAGLCRHSYVVVAGGGATLDLVGFAASTAHRGIPLVRIPSTSLSQADGGIGVKNGINFFGKKNWLGAFSIPHAVINDVTLLQGLPPREKRAGLIEAIKVALIRDAEFFEFIDRHADELAVFKPEIYEAVIRRSAEQHLEHIATAGDPFERGSARPLDFGHWSAHKIEQLSKFQVTHGEAVAIGMALDTMYAVRQGMMSETTATRIIRLIHRLGFSLYSPELEVRSERGQLAIIEGLEEFREHMGGRLSIPMVRAPGQRAELHELPTEAILQALNDLKARHG